MSTNTALRDVTRADPGRSKKPDSFPSMLTAYKGEVARALPRHMNADQVLRVALTAFRMTPKLAECEPASVFAAVIQASQLGLRANMLGECYLIPYGNNCQLIIGYQGLLELVRRSGMVDSIGAYLVREGDDYEVQFGTEPGIRHIPNLDEPGKVKFGYAVAKLKGGGTHVEIMTIREIEAIRDRSSGYKTAQKYSKKDTPWLTDFDEMARKTLIRRICKYLPKSNELAMAIQLDDAAQRGAQNLTVEDAIEQTFVPPAIEMDDASEVATEAPAKAVKPKAPVGRVVTDEAEPAPDYAAMIAAAKTLDECETIGDMLDEDGDESLRAALNARRVAIEKA